jgi:anti-sigma regulatory factor (Ser/Thr protein kinase)
MSDNSGNHSQPPEHGRAGGEAQGGGERIMPGAGMRLVLDQFFDHESLYALRNAVAAHASELGVPQSRLNDVVTVVHELAVNSIRHGAGQGRALIWHEANSLLCQVTDDGAPPAPDSRGRAAQSESRVAASARAEHGHGLWLVRQLAEEAVLRFGPDGTIASVTFTFEPRRR